MRLSLLILTLLVTVGLAATEPAFLYDPAISPDGTQVCFRYMDDLWIVPFEGGQARRLTATDATEYSPVFSADGNYIAFNSNQDHFSTIWVMPASGGQAKSISKESVGVQSWFSNGKNLLATLYQPGVGSAFVKLGLDGERPVQICTEANDLSDLSADNNRIIFQRRGDAFRERYEGSDNGDLWEYNISKAAWTRLTNTARTERYPVYSKANPGRIYFGGSDGKVFQLYQVDNYDFEHPTKLSNFKQWSIRDISIARTSDRMVFEYFDKLGCYNPDTGKISTIEVEINQHYLANYDERAKVNNKADMYVISPNGKWFAFRYKYDLFAVPVEGGQVKQLTSNQPGIDDIVIMPDNRTVYFTSYVKGRLALHKLDINNPTDIQTPSWTKGKTIGGLWMEPDSVAYIRYRVGEQNNRMARISKDGGIHTIIDDQIVSNFSAAPGGNYAVFSNRDPENWVTTMWYLDLKTLERHKLITNNKWMGNFLVSADSNSVFLTCNKEIWRVDFTARPLFEDKNNWNDILADKQPEPTTPSKSFDLENTELRFTKIATAPGYCWPACSTKDELTFVANNNGKYTLYKCDYDGKDKKELASLGNGVKYLRLEDNLKRLFYVQNGQIHSVNTSGKDKKDYDYSFTYTYNKYQLNQDIFDQVWAAFGDGFYDARMNGVDWQKVYNRYAPYAKDAYNTDILKTIIDEMIGDVNASHTGYYPRKEDEYKYYPRAYLGAVLDYANPPQNGIVLKEVYRKSPLFKVYDVTDGDILLAIDGIKITPDTAIYPLLLDKIDKKILLTIKHNDETILAEINGLDWTTNNDWRYDNWVEQRRQKVAKLSNGRLGYLHIRQMNDASFAQFEHDLYADVYYKDGFIIDVRDNGGGRIHDKLIEALTRKTYAYQQRRSMEQDRIPTPYNVYNKPKALLINEGSFSDAEIFPGLFKELGLGKIVGTPTSGGVIGTSPRELMDGSSMRMPSVGWYRLDDTNMELNGVQPDYYVEQTPAQAAADNDVQLAKAVEVVLQQLK